MNFRFVPITDDLVAPVCNAFSRVFGEARSANVWRQIYADSPDGFAGVVSVDDSNSVAGYYGATLHRVSAPDGESVVFGQIRDVFTHPSARGAGAGGRSVFARMGRNFHERFGGRAVNVIFGFPSERHFRLGARLLGYRKLAGLAMWAREVPSSVNSAAGRLGALIPVPRFGHEIDALWAHRSRTGTFATPRTAAFLNWRFVNRSDRTYRCYRYDSFLANGTAGYAVLAGSGEEARLADFRLPDDPELRRDMWRQLLERLCRHGARSLTLLASAAVPETACFASLGCVAMATPLPWIPAYVPYGHNWEDRDTGPLFHATMADGDIF